MSEERTNCLEPSGSEQVELASYVSKMGDRRVRVTLWSDGQYSIEWTLKTGYRTRRVTAVRVSALAMRQTMLCAMECANKTNKPLGWVPENTEVSDGHQNKQKGNDNE